MVYIAPLFFLGFFVTLLAPNLGGELVFASALLATLIVSTQRFSRGIMTGSLVLMSTAWAVNAWLRSQGQSTWVREDDIFRVASFLLLAALAWTVRTKKRPREAVWIGGVLLLISLIIYSVYYFYVHVNPLDSLINNSALLIAILLTLPLLQAALVGQAAPGRILWHQGLWMIWLSILLVIPAEMLEANTRRYIDGVLILGHGVLALGISAEARAIPLGSWLALLGPGTIFVLWTTGMVGLKEASALTFLSWTFAGGSVLGLSIISLLVVYHSRANNTYQLLMEEAKAREALAAREVEEAHRMQQLTETLAQPADFPSFLHRSLDALVTASGYSTAIYLERATSKNIFALVDFAGPLPSELNLRWRQPNQNIFPEEAIQALLAGETVVFNNSSELLANQGICFLAVAPVRDADRTRGLIASLSFTSSTHSPLAILNNVALTLSRALTQQSALAQVEKEREAALRSVGLMLEYRDFETKGHTDRVTKLATSLGLQIGLSETQLRNLRWGAYLHDVGKIAIPDSILFKPGSLDSQEWAVMRQHTLTGEEMLRSLGFIPEESLALVRLHHERWDGKGYPDGMSGNAIPFLARIFTLADVYDALVSPRPYKRAWTPQEAIQWITSQAGSQFDPELTELFIEVVQEENFSPETGKAAPSINLEL